MRTYLSQPIKKIEFVLGAVITFLVLFFQIEKFSFMLGCAVLLGAFLYSFGQVIGAKYYYYRIKVAPCAFIKVVLIILFLPFVTYIGWTLFLIKSFKQFTLKVG